MTLPATKWLVCGVMLLATVLNYMDRQALAVALPELKRVHDIHEGRAGLFEGCFGIAFAAGLIAFGLVVDRVGPRRLYPVVLVGWSLAGIAAGLASQPWLTNLLESDGDPPGTGVFRWLLGCRVVLGFCEAGHWPCALVTCQRLLAPADRTLGNGILQSGASSGAILMPLYAELVAARGGDWPVTFVSIGVVGLLWVPLWLGVVKPGSLDRPPAAVSRKRGRVRPGLMLGLTVVVCAITISWQFLRAWLPLYLEDFHKYTTTQTRLAVAAYFVAAEVGCLAAGFVVKSLVRRGRGVPAARAAGFALFSLLTAAAAFVPYAGGGWWMFALLFVAGAGILGLHPFYYSLSQELPAARMGLLSGLLSAAGWLLSSGFQIYIGAELKAAKNYELAFAVAGLAPLAGLAAVVLLARRPVV